MIINRDNLSDYLIRKYYNFNDIPKLDKYNQSDLLEHMILEVKDVINSKESIEEIMNNSRMIHLREYYRYKRIDIDSPRKSLVIRISDEINQLILGLSNKTRTIGEVIELAIANHINKASDSYYDLITFTIQNQSVRQEDE